MDRVIVTAGALSVGAALRSVTRKDCGGIAVFVGTVRDLNEGRRVRKVAYSAYREMALRAFREIAAGARRRGARAVYLAHRTGTLRPAEAGVICAASAPHRAEAFASCRFLIERIKKIAPIWKEEFYRRGKAWIQ